MNEIYIRTPDDALDTIESRLGYTPEPGSVTAVMQKAGESGPHITLMRISSDPQLQMAINYMRDGQLLALCIWGEAETPHTTTLGSWVTFDQPTVPVIGATKTEWWWFDDKANKTKRRASDAKLNMIMNGMDTVVFENRDAMISSRLLSEPRWGELAVTYPPCSVNEAGLWVLETLSTGNPLPKFETAAVIGALEVPMVGDDVLRGLCNLSLSGNIRRLATVNARLVEVAAEACDGHKGRVFRVIATSCYLLGAVELANAAVDLAEGDDPGKRLDGLMRQAFAAGLEPRVFATMVLETMEG